MPPSGTADLVFELEINNNNKSAVDGKKSRAVSFEK
jgi:hypothetical protein